MPRTAQPPANAGCTATKIGPRQLLLAARCVVKNRAFDVGNVLTYTVAAAKTPVLDAGLDAAVDAGATAHASGFVVVADVRVNDLYTSKCSTEICGFGKVSASDAPDIAVVIVKEELTLVPSLPVDLDPVGEADPVLVVSSGCEGFDSGTAGTPATAQEIALPAKFAGHEGSAYAAAAALLPALGAGYILTAGSAWQKTGSQLCKRDIGAPLFRAGSAAVAGVTSNFTTFNVDSKTVATVAHTRVDATSRFKVGAWLKSLGAETTHSCSELGGGCMKNTYTGGTPADALLVEGDSGVLIDGGTSDAPPAPQEGPHAEPLPADNINIAESYEEGASDYADAAIAPRTKKAATGGCNTAPSGDRPTGELGLGVVVGLALMVKRRARA